ncbi:myrosinase 1-like [Halictus rubicundus]|uniref:myrosinase 1-like n=1 Tax=Halictus rubicundus TaxID=77578 RepID=UPI004036FD2A
MLLGRPLCSLLLRSSLWRILSILSRPTREQSEPAQVPPFVTDYSAQAVMLATAFLKSSILLFLLVSANGKFAERKEENLRFPANFVLGAATAAYQVEGAWNVSDKGESTWDRYTHLKDGRIFNNDTGDVATDSYYKYKEDVALLKKLGFDSYRFSLSWPRILPTGFSNKVSSDGVKYYNDLIDELLANGIEPFVTIYHWDHPQDFEDVGGWMNSEMVDWFSDYVRVVYREFGPKVKRFVPINEPSGMCNASYAFGKHAPGKKLHGYGEYLCVHNMLKAHARAYRIYQEEFKPAQNGEVGFLINLFGYLPKTPGDNASVNTAYTFNAGWTVHPIFSTEGDYPEEMKSKVAAKSKQQGYARSRLPEFEPHWIEYIKGTADFLAVNHYTTRLAEPGEHAVVPSQYNDQGVIFTTDPSWKTAASKWLQVSPEGFRGLLHELSSRYGNPPLYVTENGFSDYGTVNDTDRIDYFRSYLKEMLEAIHVDGINLRGYYVWSLLDNFEWDRGYSERFGIVHVDFNDPKRPRTLKQSARWWQDLLASRQLTFP